MDDRRLGLFIRAVRRRRRWRQVDLALASGVSQSLISLVERGHLDGVTVHTLRSILGALEARVVLDVRWKGGALDRIVDERHARLVNLIVSILSAFGWQVVVEASFSHFGERGSIDVLAWHERLRTLLVIEVKSELTSIEETVRRLDVKTRLARQVIAAERGWRPERIGVILALPETTAARSIVGTHEALFRNSFPARSREVRHWLGTPDRNLRGVWFLSPTTRSSDRQRPAGTDRIRVRAAMADSRHAPSGVVRDGSSG